MILFALPTGLGLATGDLRATVLMFLIPAIAIYFSTFIGSLVSARVGHARKDYGRMLLLIGLVEVIAGFSIFVVPANFQIIPCFLFVIFYAFSKEGISRLFYSVWVYKFFVDDNEYSRLLSKDFALRACAVVLGGFLASWLISNDLWQSALFLDAITFLLLALAILFCGRDVVSAEHDTAFSSVESEPDKANLAVLDQIRWIIPFTSFFSCLFAPYLPVLVSELGISPASQNVVYTAVITVPLMILSRYAWSWGLPVKIFLLGLPLFLFISGVSLFITVNFYSYMLMVVAYAAYGSLFPIFDYPHRNKLSSKKQIEFNTGIVRRFSITQASSCFLAIVLMSFDLYMDAILPTLVFLLVVFCGKLLASIKGSRMF